HAYRAAARALGGELVRRRIGLVTGAGGTGLMGEVIDAVLRGGGEAIGVIPHALVLRELAHAGLADLRVVSSMHERKALMAELSDGFVALPGGIGTFEELLEIMTWAQLGLHGKPVGVVNVRGYYDRFLAFLDHAAGEGFLKPLHRGLLLVGRDPADLLARFERFEPAPVEKWITPDEA
ncbi:MAG TPA: TIGR00730 family Rossman fold protein, partial [Planctomycetota bacterium]|nr:TIGR00730 family Rossman fold protein [Planctomycetota bacterium]